MNFLSGRRLGGRTDAALVAALPLEDPLRPHRGLLPGLLAPNLWSARGNGWRADDAIRVDCLDPLLHAAFDCGGCDAFNVSSSSNAGNPGLMGVYNRVDDVDDGFLAPVFGKGDDAFLYSHHHQGRVWLLGRSLTTWSMRLDLIGVDADVESAAFCPDDERTGGKWAFLQSQQRGEQVWVDSVVSVECVAWSNGA